MNIKIVGNGAWGNAFYSVISRNTPYVHIFGREQIEIKRDDILVLAVPTESARDVLEKTLFKTESPIIVNTSKGIEKETHMLPYQIVKEFLGNEIDYYSLIGPSFAKEVQSMMPTIVNLGYTKGTLNDEVKKLFQTDYFRVRLTLGVEALEISAAFKNIYAIACGLTSGLGYGTNTRVKLMVLAIEELNRLFESLKIELNSDMIPGTIGDLILTCSNEKSRNFTFGKLISIKSVDEAINQIGATVEGYNSLSSVGYFKTKSKINLPLATFVCEVAKQDNPEKSKDFFDRFVKSI